MFIGDFMGRGATYYPERLAVVDVARGLRLTYRQMNERAQRLARCLKNQGIGRGDRVALLLLNGVEVLDALFACGKLGAVLAPLNFRLHPAELTDLTRRLRPSALLSGREFVAGAEAICKESPEIYHLPDTVYESTLAQTEPGEGIENPNVNQEDLLCLLLTGGTTGVPKAAKISYRMIAWNILTTVVHELQQGDVTLTHTPMFHTGGLLVYTLPLLTLGGTVVIQRKWTAEQMLRLIGEERVTVLFCVPTQYQALLTHESFATSDFSSVRFLTSGGEPLPVPLLAAFRKVHNVPFKQGFGMTEFGPGVFSMGPEHVVSKAGSIGRPNYFVDARVVDEEGQDVRRGHTGELWLKGPACCSGYFEMEEESRAAIAEDGWLRTGDLARVDEDGFYFLVGRKKDMFISGGENVYPIEIEEVFLRHPKIASCAVIGVTDPTWGQVGKAFVVLSNDEEPSPSPSPSAEELLAYVRDRLARYKVPKEVVFLPSLPLSAAGKVLKRELHAFSGTICGSVPSNTLS